MKNTDDRFAQNEITKSNLSSRAGRVLSHQNGYKLKKDVKRDIENGIIYPNNSKGFNNKEFGFKTYEEICRWVGIDLQSLKKCPHCGRVLFGFKEK
jgi:hypothetical protein